MTNLIDVLEEPTGEGREKVEAIEDTLQSLEAYGGDEPTLNAVLASQVADLEASHGFRYSI